MVAAADPILLPSLLTGFLTRTVKDRRMVEIDGE
jgi:hypothetical protein